MGPAAASSTARASAGHWIAFLVFCAPAFWVALAFLLNRHSLGSLLSGVAAIPATPIAVLIGMRLFRSMSGYGPGRIVVVLVCGGAILITIIAAYLIFVLPRH